MILYIAQSIDGYIAKKDGSIDFLEQEYYKNPDKINYVMKNDYSNFVKDIDVIITGFKTYKQVYDILGENPYKEFENYVITNNNKGFKDSSVNGFINFNEFLNLDLHNKKVWIVGGSEIVRQSFEHKLITELNLFIVPTVLNEGIKLFNQVENVDFQLQDSENDSWLVNINYDIKYKR